MRLKASWTASGTMPGSDSVPRIVCVLPELVWPYANTVLLKPLTTLWMSGSVVASKIWRVVAEGSNTLSSVYLVSLLRSGSRVTASHCTAVLFSRRQQKPSCCSCLLSGLTRTLTLRQATATPVSGARASGGVAAIAVNLPLQLAHLMFSMLPPAVPAGGGGISASAPQRRISRAGSIGD
jgi:hypothetical protein